MGWLLAGIAIVIIGVAVGLWLQSKGISIWPELLLVLILILLGWSLAKQPSVPSFAGSLFPQSPTPKPSLTPTLSSGEMYLKIPIEKIAQLEMFAARVTGGEIARMVVISKKNVTAANGATFTDHGAETICVGVQSFLNEDSKANAYSGETTKSVLIKIKEEDLELFAKTMADVEQIYFTLDSSCPSRAAVASVTAQPSPTLAATTSPLPPAQPATATLTP
jgi:hypothetical protein